MGKIGKGSSRNMYKGHMDKAKGGRIEDRKLGWVGQWEHCGMKIETSVLEQK